VIGQVRRQEVTTGVPVASRYTPSITAVSGTDLARPVAGGLDLLPSRSLTPGQPLRRLDEGGACAIAAATPSGVLDLGEATQDDPGTREGTETPASTSARTLISDASGWLGVSLCPAELRLRVDVHRPVRTHCDASADGLLMMVTSER